MAKASKHAVKSAIKPTTPFDPRWATCIATVSFAVQAATYLCKAAQLLMSHWCCGRSLRQIKQELKAAAAKPKVLPGLSSDSKASNTTMYTGAVCVADAEESEEASSALCKALDDLLIAPKASTSIPSTKPVLWLCNFVHMLGNE